VNRRSIMAERPNIYGYNNFRKFLADFYDFRHSRDRGFTKAFVCQELGLPNSRSYFQDVLNGKTVSDLKLPLFIKLFRLPHDESQFFRVLVRFNQCDDPDEKELLLDQLISLNRTPQTLLSLKAYAYYKEWYHAAIRAILDVTDFKGDYATLARLLLPPIKTRQARESIKLLLQLGLVRKNEKGFLKPTDKVLATAAFAQEAILRQFQLKSLDAARLALLKNHKQPHRVIIKTISISEQGYKRLERHIDKFNSEIRSLVHKDENQADRMYQLAVTLIPQMRKA
jgi:uncharacterized protein (TIGR02147 family)